MSKDGSSGVTIDIVYTGGIVRRLLHMWDDDWNLCYLRAGDSTIEKIPVDGNKDFYINLDDDKLEFECLACIQKLSAGRCLELWQRETRAEQCPAAR